MPQLAQAVIDAVALPGDVMSGRVPIRGADGQITDEAIEGAATLAGVVSPISRVPGVRPPIPPRAARPATEGQQAAAAGRRLGIDVPRAVASESPAINQIGKAAAGVPIAGSPLRQASARAIEQMDDAARGISTSLGEGTVAGAGAAARDEIATHITKGIADQVRRRYEAVDELVNPTITRPLTATQKKVSEIVARRQGAALPGEGNAVGQVTAALGRREGLTYEGLRQLRTAVGEQLNNSLLPANISKAELKQIYGALSDDLRATALQAGGQRALKAFETANRFSARKDVERKALDKILKPQGDEGVFEKIITMARSNSRANVRDLGRARGAVSRETWDEIASAAIQRMGRNADDQFTPDRFITEYGKLSPSGKRLLFGSTGKPTVQALDDLARVSRQFKKNEFANPSGTAQQIAVFGSGMGAVYDPVTLLFSITGARLVSGYLAKPAIAKQVSGWAKAYEAAVRKPTVAARRAVTVRSQVLGLTIARESGVPHMAAQFGARLDNVAPANEQQDENRGQTPTQVPAQGVVSEFDPRIGA